MKQINTEILKSLNPCEDRYKVWLEHYKNFNGTILEFLDLDRISAQDKIWVAIRMMPRFLVEVFAIDCAFSAYAALAVETAADAAYYAADAAYDANAAADAAYYAADADAAADDADANAAERENQVDALIMLIKSEVNND